MPGMQPEMQMGQQPGGASEYTPQAILEARRMVEAQKPTFQPLWQRMAKDLELYRLKAYDGHGSEWGSRRAKGLESYTSNEPQVVANKLISTVSESQDSLERLDRT